MFEEQQICACSGHSLGKASPEPSHLGEKGSWDSEPASSTGKTLLHWERHRCHPSPCLSPGAALLQNCLGWVEGSSLGLLSSTPAHPSCPSCSWEGTGGAAGEEPQGGSLEPLRSHWSHSTSTGDNNRSWSCPGPSGAWCWFLSMA